MIGVAAQIHEIVQQTEHIDCKRFGLGLDTIQYEIVALSSSPSRVKLHNLTVLQGLFGVVAGEHPTISEVFPDMAGKGRVPLASPALLLTQKKLQAPPKSDILLDTEIPILVDNTLRPRDRNFVLWLCALRPGLPSNRRFTVHKTQFIACPDGFFQYSTIHRCAVLRLILCRQVDTAAKSIFTIHATLTLVRVLITT